MEKQEVIYLLSKIKKGNFSLQDFFNLKELFLEIDPFLNIKWRRKILGLVRNIDNEWGEILLSVLDRDVSLEKLAYDSSVDSKEVEEVRYFNSQVMEIFKGRFDCVYDMCCGNGLNGFYWLATQRTKFVEFYDKTENRYFRTLSSHFTNHRYNLKNIFESHIFASSDSLFVSIHACGSLTDQVIDMAIGNRKPFAVMPCCYEFHNNRYFSPELIDYFSDKEDAIDAARVRKIQNRGFKVILRNIPKEISDKNRIIIGVPYF
jgi:hypothetical protein